MSSSGWISRSEAMAVLGLPLSTFRRRAAVWHLQDRLIDGEHFYLRSEIEMKLVSENESAPAPATPTRSTGESLVERVANQARTFREVGVDGEVCAKIFRLLEGGCARADVVRHLKLLPAVVDLVAAEWTEQRKIIQISVEMFEKMNELAAAYEIEENEPLIDSLQLAIDAAQSRNEFDNFQKWFQLISSQYLMVNKRNVALQLVNESDKVTPETIFQTALDMAQKQEIPLH